MTDSVDNSCSLMLQEFDETLLGTLRELLAEGEPVLDPFRLRLGDEPDDGKKKTLLLHMAKVLFEKQKFDEIGVLLSETVFSAKFFSLLIHHVAHDTPHMLDRTYARMHPTFRAVLCAAKECDSHWLSLFFVTAISFVDESPHTLRSALTETFYWAKTLVFQTLNKKNVSDAKLLACNDCLFVLYRMAINHLYVSTRQVVDDILQDPRNIIVANMAPLIVEHSPNLTLDITTAMRADASDFVVALTGHDSTLAVWALVMAKLRGYTDTAAALEGRREENVSRKEFDNMSSIFMRDPRLDNDKWQTAQDKLWNRYQKL